MGGGGEVPEKAIQYINMLIKPTMCCNTTNHVNVTVMFNFGMNQITCMYTLD